jgi:hypothetical protein
MKRILLFDNVGHGELTSCLPSDFGLDFGRGSVPGWMPVEESSPRGTQTHCGNEQRRKEHLHDHAPQEELNTQLHVVCFDRMDKAQTSEAPAREPDKDQKQQPPVV